MWGSSSYLSHSVTLLPTDGQCVARFQMAYWEYYHVENPIIGTEKDYWWIRQTQNWYVTYNIFGSSQTTCSDDLESISYSGYSSIGYAARYATQDRREDNPSSSWYAITRTAGAMAYVELDVRITVSVQGTGIGVGVFHQKNTQQVTWTYKYWFGPNHSWSIDYLDSLQNLWTFRSNW